MTKYLEDGEGYERLAWEMIRAAMVDYAQLTQFAKRKDRVRAVEWIREGETGAISLQTCCELLDLSPRTVRMMAEDLVEHGDFIGITKIRTED